MARTQSILATRNLFPELFKILGYRRGAEIGVASGNFSRVLKTYGGELFLVDAWKHIAGLNDMNNLDDAGHECRYNMVKELFQGDSLVTIRRGLSVDVAKTFQDGELDWVYIDADHRKESVAADLSAWFPKVRIGGMLCGHDYIDGSLLGGEFGVKSAVDEFFQGDSVFETMDEAVWSRSWFTTKQGE